MQHTFGFGLDDTGFSGDPEDRSLSFVDLSCSLALLVTDRLEFLRALHPSSAKNRDGESGFVVTSWDCDGVRGILSVFSLAVFSSDKGATITSTEAC